MCCQILNPHITSPLYATKIQPQAAANVHVTNHTNLKMYSDKYSVQFVTHLCWSKDVGLSTIFVSSFNHAYFVIITAVFTGCVLQFVLSLCLLSARWWIVD